jgi:hypothetical protein
MVKRFGLKVEAFEFATFACEECGEKQTHAVRVKKKFQECIKCGCPHRITPEERGSKPPSY